MTNYFELFDKRLSAIETAQQEIIARLAATSNAPDEVGGIPLATQVTRLSEARIYTLVSKRRIPHSKRGNRLSFRRSDLLAWLAEGNREQKNGPEL